MARILPFRFCRHWFIALRVGPVCRNCGIRRRLA